MYTTIVDTTVTVHDYVYFWLRNPHKERDKVEVYIVRYVEWYVDTIRFEMNHC